MKNQNNQLLLLRLLKTVRSSKQLVSKEYWHANYLFIYTFNVLVVYRDPPQPWSLYCAVAHLQKNYRKSRKIWSNNSLQLQPVTSTLQYKNIKISSYCSLVGLSVWRFFPSFSFILEYYSFLMLQGTINQRSGTQMLLSLET